MRLREWAGPRQRLWHGSFVQIVQTNTHPACKALHLDSGPLKSNLFVQVYHAFHKQSTTTILTLRRREA